MAKLALIYPNISQDDYETIQNVRKLHDPKYYDVVDPHVTIVFGTDKVSADELAELVREKLSDMKSFNLKFDSVKLVEDDSKEFYHAFLIPSVGFDEINKVHDILYSDVLESELRHDIPFIPHLGIGTGNKNEMETLVNKLLESQITIEGIAEEISIVQYDGVKVNNYLSVPLS